MKNFLLLVFVVAAALVATIFSVSVSASSSSSTTTDDIPPQFAYVTGDSINTLQIHRVTNLTQIPSEDNPLSQLLANATFIPTQNITGWSTFYVKANPHRISSSTSNDVHLAYAAAGYLEGYLLSQQIADTYENSFFMPNPPKITLWIEQNIQFTEYICTSLKTNSLPKNVTSKFATQLCKLFSQVKGILQGYNAVPQQDKPWNNNGDANNGKDWSLGKMWMLNAQASIMDLFVYCNISMMMSSSEQQEQQEQLTKTKTTRKHHSRSPFSFQKLVSLPSNHNKKNAPPLISSEEQQEHQQEEEVNYLDQHCSALVKVTHDDVIFSHTTWAQTNMLIRVFKTYTFLPDAEVVLSGYPGVISSVDDFYVSSRNKLGVMETTFSQNNKTLTKLYSTPWTAVEFMRIMVATMAADSGEEWKDLFLMLNDGTYCNTWMVIDGKKIEVRNYTSSSSSSAGSQQQLQQVTLHDGAFWVVDALPGPTASASSDCTQVLRDTSYFSSYNIPYHPSAFEKSGNLHMQNLYGAYFSLNHTARANIFRRDHHLVTSPDTMQSVMRSNRYKTDPFSRIPLDHGYCGDGCKPDYAPTLDIAARGDLAATHQEFPSNYPAYMEGFFAPAAFGALDDKVSSVRLAGFLNSSLSSSSSSVKVHAQCGATTYDGNPPLQLSALSADLQMKIYGTYQGKFNFPFMIYDSSDALLTRVEKSSLKKIPADSFSTFAKVGVALACCVVFALIIVTTHHVMKEEEEEDKIANEQTRLVQ